MYELLILNSLQVVHDRTAETNVPNQNRHRFCSKKVGPVDFTETTEPTEPAETYQN